MDEATWTAAADTNHISASERPHILADGHLWVQLHPEQARGLNGFEIAIARVSSPPGPRRPVSREEHVLPDRTSWSRGPQNLRERYSSGRSQ